MTSSSGMKVSSLPPQRLREKGETQRPHSWLPSFTRGAQSAQQRIPPLPPEPLLTPPRKMHKPHALEIWGGMTVTSTAVLVSVGEKAAYCELITHNHAHNPFLK